MISGYIIGALFLMNMCLSLAMVYTFENNVNLLKSKAFRLFILIPPVAIIIFFCVVIFGILYCLWMLLSNYLN
jgi:hypothetical protein